MTTRKRPDRLAWQLKFLALGVLGCGLLRELTARPLRRFFDFDAVSYAFLLTCLLIALALLGLAAVRSVSEPLSKTFRGRIDGEIHRDGKRRALAGRVELFPDPNVSVVPVNSGTFDDGEFGIENLPCRDYQLWVEVEDGMTGRVGVRLTEDAPVALVEIEVRKNGPARPL